MKPVVGRVALGRAKLELLFEGLKVPAKVTEPCTVEDGETATRAQMPAVVVENPSHDSERDTRIYRLNEIQAAQRKHKALVAEYRESSKEQPDQAKLPGWIREADAHQNVLAAALQQQFLPQHSPDQLISPQLFFMSRLFNVKSRAAPREALVEFELGATSRGGVTYAGPEMRQGDGLIFMAVLNIIRDVQVGKRASFEPLELCKALWGTYNGEARNRLRQSLFRLQRASVRFPEFSVQLVQRFEFPKRGRWSVVMDEDIVHLFSESRLVWLDLEQRRSLPEGVATWLYAYIESQTALIPWPVERLREMCGSDAQPREFSIILSRALGRLAGIGIIDEGWFVKSGMVHWRKPALRLK